VRKRDSPSAESRVRCSLLFSRTTQHRLAEKIDNRWTIRGLSRHRGVTPKWFYHRIRSGWLGEPDVIRKPPYDNYLVRDDAELLARLRAEIKRTRQLRKPASTCG
jgi:hypothetical protein